MEIEEAFTTEAIEAAGTNVTEAEEEALKDMIRRAFSEIEVSHNNQIVDLCVFVFVAGRTHQAGNTSFTFTASMELANEFMEFLTSRKE